MRRCVEPSLRVIELEAPRKVSDFIEAFIGMLP